MTTGRRAEWSSRELSLGVELCGAVVHALMATTSAQDQCASEKEYDKSLGDQQHMCRQ